MQTSDRDAAVDLRKRIGQFLADPSQVDEAGRPKDDRSPGYANALMSEDPQSIEKAAHITRDDWELIRKALAHYASSLTSITGN